LALVGKGAGGHDPGDLRAQVQGGGQHLGLAEPAGLAEFELPPQAVAITAMPAIAIIAGARHKERFGPEGLVNSAWLPRMGELSVGAGNGRRRAVARSGRPDNGPERGHSGRRMKTEFMQYAAAKSGFVGLRGLIGADGYRY
jgi:hypothetical protein